MPPTVTSWLFHRISFWVLSLYLLCACDILFQALRIFRQKSGRRGSSGKVLNEKLHLNNNGPPTLSKGRSGIVFQDCNWGSRRSFTHPAFKDLSILSKSGMLSLPSFILSIIVERLILGGLWFHIKLDRDLFTCSTKPVGTLRTIFERAKLLIMFIFLKSLKSLEDQTF